MIGRTLRNRYEIIELVGDGATATVYRARDNRLGRYVALKVLLPQVKETVRKRFLQEATAVAQLNHPNIMAIYDMDEENGAHFLVVEYVEGESLMRYIPSPPKTVIELGKQIALALHYAHERDIIHRDIKPANIKVTPEGQIKIMDLGLALPKEAKRVTADGMIIGTPAYLSPEQAQGLTLDRRTDIYSLGVVLFEMLTGQLPFSTDDIPALLLQHVKQVPPAPRSINPDIPPALEHVILRTLEKNPSRRYQNGEVLAQALEAALPDDLAAKTSTSTHSARTAGAETRTIRLVVADDHNMLRRTLVNFLSEHPEFDVIGEASNGEAALEQTINLQPDVLMLDLNMPGKGGLDILPQVRAQAPKVKVLVLTGRDEDWYITQALRSGAHGYILKSASEEDLVDAIQKVAQGNLVLGHGITEKVVTGMLGSGSKQLTDIERRVLLLVAAGYENDDIAAQTNLSLAAAIETLAHAMNKLGAKDRYAAALKALRRGDILLDELHALDTHS